MSKKDYILISGSLKTALENSQGMQDHTFKVLCESLSYALENENPRFDRSKFLTACGLGESTPKRDRNGEY